VTFLAFQMEEGGLDVKLVILGATDVGKTSLTMR
jgi:GTPase SAR1 family protein